MANDDIRSTADADARVAAASASADPVTEIKGEIARTQADLVDTVAAIQQRLSPANLVDRAKQAARQTARSTVARITSASRNAASTSARRAEAAAGRARLRLQNQPAPAVLIAAGLASMFWRLYSTRARVGRNGRPPR